MAKEDAYNNSGVLFNKAYARRIRDFDGDCDVLRDDLVGMLREINGREQGWMPYCCMDPFTCLTILNRGYSWESRIEICRRLKEYWSVDVEIPDSFASIPIASNMNSAFAYGSNRPESDPDGSIEAEYREKVSQLWICFEVFVDFSLGKRSREDFIDAYDRVRAIDGVGTPKLTMSLYWIDGEFYLSLDKHNVELLKKKGLQPSQKIGELDGAHYLEFLDVFKGYLKKSGMSLFDFSAEAYGSRKVEDDVQWWPSEDEFRTQISKEQWVSLLHNPSVFDEFSLRTVKQISIMGGDASYKELADEFGFNVGSYSANVLSLCKRVQSVTGCEIPDEKDAKYWPIMFLGRRTRGFFAYKFRKELEAAMEESQDVLGGVEAYNYNRTEPDVPSPALKSRPLNTILYGPPGTGKTYATARMAVEIITGKSLDYPFDEYNRLRSEGRIGFVTFHQSYSYEEFVEGLRPDTDEEGRISYGIQDGIFKEFCNRARNAGAGPPSLGLNPAPQVWKVSLNGTGDNEVRRDCLQNGHIRIGWREYGENISDETAFTSGGKLVLNAFINRMSVGDVVVSCYSAETTDAIGIVTGGYRYDPRGGEFPRYRDVRWIRRFGVPQDITSLNSGKAMTLASVYRLDVSLPEVLALAGVDGKDGKASDDRFVFIIDEINRGNISRILGELITLLEQSKREGSSEALSVTLPYSKSRFGVPPNVYVIGTMNTADRSLVSLDAALRRRFVFREMMPDYSLVSDDVDGIDVRKMLETMNERIEALYDRDHVIGHSYLMSVKTLGELNGAFESQILPLLQEYFMDDFERIGQVLSKFGGDGSDSMFVNRKQCSSKLKNAPSHRYEMAPGPFSRDMYLSLYSNLD